MQEQITKPKSDDVTQFRQITDFCRLVDELVVKLFNLFVEVQSQGSKIKTFEETMAQLDQVFTNTATMSPGQSTNNQKIAGEIRKLRENQLEQIFTLQSELSHFTSFEALKKNAKRGSFWHQAVLDIQACSPADHQERS